MAEQDEQKQTQGVTVQAESAGAECEHTTKETPQQPQRMLYGDDAIRYQSQVIVAQNRDFQRIRTVNNGLDQRIVAILSVLPKMCSCKASSYINRIIQETDALIVQNRQQKRQIAECDEQIAAMQKLLGDKKIEIDQVD